MPDMLLRIALSVVLSAFFEDAAKLLLKLSNCNRVQVLDFLGLPLALGLDPFG